MRYNNTSKQDIYESAGVWLKMGTKEFVVISATLTLGFLFCMSSFYITRSFIRTSPYNAIVAYIKKKRIDRDQFFRTTHPFSERKKLYNSSLPRQLLLLALLINFAVIVVSIFIHGVVFVLPFTLYATLFSVCFFHLNKKNILMMEEHIPELSDRLVEYFNEIEAKRSS
jgi:Flp pilus assembly protein TadB